MLSETSYTAGHYYVLSAVQWKDENIYSNTDICDNKEWTDNKAWVTAVSSW